MPLVFLNSSRVFLYMFLKDLRSAASAALARGARAAPPRSRGRGGSCGACAQVARSRKAFPAVSGTAEATIPTMMEGWKQFFALTLTDGHSPKRGAGQNAAPPKLDRIVDGNHSFQTIPRSTFVDWLAGGKVDFGAKKSNFPTWFSRSCQHGG